MGFNTKINLVDISSVLNKATGKRSLQIAKKTTVFADEQEVGLQEFYSAYSNKKELVAVYEIPEHLYHGESYLLVGTKQYAITRAAKGRSLGYIRLPCTKCQQKDLLEGYSI